MRTIVVFLLLGCGGLPAQWEPDIRLTRNDSSSHTSFNNVRSIAAGPQSTLHVVWYDHRAGTDQIFYKRSTDDGTTWSQDTNLTDTSGTKSDPSLAASGDTLHLVWEDGRYGYATEVMYRRSTDAGVTWSAEQRITSDAFYSRNPAVACKDSIVHVAWANDTAGRELYYIRSTDAGATWVDRRRLTFDIQESWYPSIAAESDYVHIAWRDFRDHSFEVYYLRSTDRGVTWDSTPKRLSGDVATGSYNPCLCASGSYVHVVWWDTRHMPYELYYRRSYDNGLTWSTPETRLTNDTTGSYNPTICADGANVHVVWEALYGTADIYHLMSTNRGATWLPETRLTNVPFFSVSPSAALLDSGVHVVWTDFRDNDYGEIYYKRNLTGNVVGAAEQEPVPPQQMTTATIARGVLFLPRDMTAREAGGRRPLPGNSDRVPRPTSRAALLDITGRKVLDLRPGANDVSHLAPGVYFVRTKGQRDQEIEGSSVRKVIVTR